VLARRFRKNTHLVFAGNMLCRMADSSPKRTPMSKEHKAALAEGREQGRAVRRYLEALEAHRPRRGRKRTPESMEKRLVKVEDELATADPLKRLHLIQERLDLQSALATNDAKVDLETLEKEFIEAAQPYSSRKGISYSAWRELGVPSNVLVKAGIARGA
jgi:hypothetical protein